MIDWATNGVALLWKRGTNYHKNGRRFKNARMKYNSSSNIQTMVRLFFSFIFFYHFFFLSPGASDENICDHDGPRGQFYKKKPVSTITTFRNSLADCPKFVLIRNARKLMKS